MTKMELFLSTLNEEELELVRKSIDQYGEEYKKYDEETLLGVFQRGLTWGYRLRAEDAVAIHAANPETPAESKKWVNRRLEPVDIWRKKGLIPLR